MCVRGAGGRGPVGGAGGGVAGEDVGDRGVVGSGAELAGELLEGRFGGASAGAGVGGVVAAGEASAVDLDAQLPSAAVPADGASVACRHGWYHYHQRGRWGTEWGTVGGESRRRLLGLCR